MFSVPYLLLILSCILRTLHPENPASCILYPENPACCTYQRTSYCALVLVRVAVPCTQIVQLIPDIISWILDCWRWRIVLLRFADKVSPHSKASRLSVPYNSRTTFFCFFFSHISHISHFSLFRPRFRNTNPKRACHHSPPFLTS